MKELPQFIGRAQSTIYQMIQRGEFPKPHRVSHKVALWTRRQITEYQRSLLGEERDAS
jgi:predicted DNA-binding transcriptional regulator AlpA